MKPYEEFRTEWMKAADSKEAVDDMFLQPEFDDLREYFCECDYKRYTSEWKETL